MKISDIIDETMENIIDELGSDLIEPAGVGCGFGFSESSEICARSHLLRGIEKIIKNADSEYIKKLREDNGKS